MATTFQSFKRTKLYRAMQSNPAAYGSDEDIEDAFHDMRERIEGGEDPEEVLHEEGIEPDYIFDLL